ncbi:MAG: hypothetical protein RL634_1440 [Bacteroidota bacterium]
MKLICIFYTMCGELWFQNVTSMYLRKKTTFDQPFNMKKIIAFLLLLTAMISCNKKAKDINQDEGVVVSDFIQSFNVVELPVQFKAEYFDKKESDSSYIKPAVVSKFIPDSIFKNELGKLKDVKFYRKGRFTAEETEEIYLFLTAQKKEKRFAYILCFDKNEIFKTGMLLSEKSMNPTITYEGTLDKRLTIAKLKNSNIGTGKAYYNKSVYVYNTEGVFTLILTESNEPVVETEVYNPIDTLPMTGPLSGNYVQDKKNFISVRDGGKPGKLLFFINVDKYGKSCTGSLRGDMSQVKPKVFQYNKADDHCVLEFTFSSSGLKVKELEACGNHRSVRCSFDGSFSKQKKKSKK